jgi:virulence-associated protein VapD
MYAITFHLDTLSVEKINMTLGDAYRQINAALGQRFIARQGGYFGDKSVDAVTCVLAAQSLSKELPWFKSVVKEMQMLRIEEINNLMIAL